MEGKANAKASNWKILASLREKKARELVEETERREVMLDW